MPKKTLIITGANTAREINPYIFTLGGDNYLHHEAQRSLKEYRITPTPEQSKLFRMMEEKAGGKIQHMNYRTNLPVGTKVECETNEELLTFYIL